MLCAVALIGAGTGMVRRINLADAGNRGRAVRVGDFADDGFGGAQQQGGYGDGAAAWGRRDGVAAGQGGLEDAGEGVHAEDFVGGRGAG